MSSVWCGKGNESVDHELNECTMVSRGTQPINIYSENLKELKEACIRLKEFMADKHMSDEEMMKKKRRKSPTLTYELLSRLCNISVYLYISGEFKLN